MKNQQSYSFSATCSTGTENLVAREIQNMGGESVEEGHGVVSWKGSLESGYRCCLWSRFSSRVLLYLQRFDISDENSLYDCGLTINWWEHLSVGTTFAVDCTVSKTEEPIHSRFASLRVKDAIVDQLRQKWGERPSVELDRPGVRIHVLIKQRQATFFIDLSGESLHKRGYRVEKSLAPLKENLAAALVGLSGWLEQDTPISLIDPMCGSGTILIEAALMYGDSAPGLFRKYFGFIGWENHDAGLWNDLVEEALSREHQGNSKQWPVMLGYDSDYHAVKGAKKNIVNAGLEDRIQINTAEVATLSPPSETGLILSNLPFGERLSEAETVSWLYRGVGRIVGSRFPGWRLALFISNPELTDSFGIQWQKKIQLYNGPLRCRLLLSDGHQRTDQDFIWRVDTSSTAQDNDPFCNRLKKNLKKTLKWSRKNNISCFRLYDRDLPEYNVSIDFYGKWVHVQEFAPPATVDKNKAAERFQHVLRGIRNTLNIRGERIFVKTRQRQRGKNQYQKKRGRKRMLEVQEGECRLLVNLSDYLDTGLFLDHRPIRKRINELASGKRFLNLFGYTGAATVQAVMGGAVATTTVDLSSNYLNWARMNLALNGLDTVKNTIVVMDCLKWLQESTEQFDLIFIDPPTFSNTKKEKRVFDIQRDHYQLITQGVARLARGGLLIFSTNYKRFKLEQQLFTQYAINDISRASIPFDFSRNTTIHKCWEIRKLE